MEIISNIKELSNQGLVNLIQNDCGVKLIGDESRQELEEILQLNVDDGVIDEILIIMELGGE